jgi:hypothetical protein
MFIIGTLSTPQAEHMLHEGREFCSIPFILWSDHKYLEWCLAYAECLVNVCWMNEWVHKLSLLFKYQKCEEESDTCQRRKEINIRGWTELVMGVLRYNDQWGNFWAVIVHSKHALLKFPIGHINDTFENKWLQRTTVCL